jgi:transcriptional regulator with XRE-family HTH domain
MSEKQRFLGVKKFRERMGWSQKKLAEKLGCKNLPVYHHWETGRCDPSFEIVQKLLEMGATVEELFGVDYKGSGGVSGKEFEEKVLAVLSKVSNSGTIQIGVRR